VRRVVPATVFGSALACGGLFVDHAGLGHVREAMTASEPALSAALLARGATEVGLVRFRCAQALEAYAEVDPAQRQALLAAALTDPMGLCPTTCGGGAALVTELGALPAHDRTTTAVSRCDAEGADPVFGGALAPLRSGMPALEYLVFRAVLERAQAADVGFGDLRDEVATAIVLGGRPDLSPTDIVATDGSFAPPPNTFTTLADALRTCDSPHLQHRLVIAPGGGVVAVAGGPDRCVADQLAALTFPTTSGWGFVDVTWTVPPAPVP
jgi:hypothetical protein